MTSSAHSRTSCGSSFGIFFSCSVLLVLAFSAAPGHYRYDSGVYVVSSSMCRTADLRFRSPYVSRSHFRLSLHQPSIRPSLPFVSCPFASGEQHPDCLHLVGAHLAFDARRLYRCAIACVWFSLLRGTVPVPGSGAFAFCPHSSVWCALCAWTFRRPHPLSFSKCKLHIP